MNSNPTGVEDMLELTQDDVYQPISDTSIEAKAPGKLDQTMDYVKMIKEIGKFNPIWANNLWYKLHNQPGQIKTVGDTNYIVSPRGNWVKQLQTN